MISLSESSMHKQQNGKILLTKYKVRTKNSSENYTILAKEENRFFLIGSGQFNPLIYGTFLAIYFANLDDFLSAVFYVNIF